MEFTNQQFREALQEASDDEKLYIPTAEEIEIADKLIGNNLSEVTKELIQHRKRADTLIKIPKDKKEEVEKNGSPDEKRISREYPIGCCVDIRNAVMKSISSSASTERNLSKSCKSILTQIAEALKVKEVWGVKNDAYLHAGIQVGNYFLDSANDTVDVKQPKIAVSTIEQAGFRDVRSIQDYLDISIKYRGTTFERNPITKLATFFPVIETNNRLTFRGTLQPKLIQIIPTSVAADSILRSGLAEFRNAYDSMPETDEETKRIIRETLCRIEDPHRDFHTNPLPPQNSEFSIEDFFFSASQMLYSPEMDAEILDKLNDMVNSINKILICTTEHQK